MIETRAKDIILQMKKDKVLSQSTKWYDVKLLSLVKDARKQRRKLR